MSGQKLKSSTTTDTPETWTSTVEKCTKPTLRKRISRGTSDAVESGPEQTGRGGDKVLSIRPITLRAANAFVAEYHRHNQPTNGHKWSVVCYEGERLCGVAIAGQPVARKLDDGLTVEIRRVCTDRTKTLVLSFAERVRVLRGTWAIKE